MPPGMCATAPTTDILGDVQVLTRLNLSGTPVADADLPALQALPRLRTLLINRQPIRDDATNAGLAHIAQLQALTCLELQGNCTITASGREPCALVECLAWMR